MKKAIVWALCFAAVTVISAVIYGVHIDAEVSAFRDSSYSKQITVYDWNKKEYPFWVGPKNQRYTPWSRISHYIKWAVILSEDGKFYRHHGVDYEALRSALKKNMEVGRYVRGGSTITQQLAKNLFLSREKTIIRKLKELVITFLIEYRLSKTRILELYLNVVECGPMVYGIPHASEFYFNKSAGYLNPLESALLASLLPGPKRFDPYRRLDTVEVRAKRVLKTMFDAKVVSEDEYERLKNANLTIGMERTIGVTLNAPDAGGFVPRSSLSVRAFRPFSSGK